MFFGAVTITNTSTGFYEKMLHGPQEIEEHICQNGAKSTQTPPEEMEML